MSPSLVKKRVSHLAYKLDILSNQKIILVFPIAPSAPMPALSKHFFEELGQTQLPSVFVNGKINVCRPFQVEWLFKKQKSK